MNELSKGYESMSAEDFIDQVLSIPAVKNHLYNDHYAKGLRRLLVQTFSLDLSFESEDEIEEFLSKLKKDIKAVLNSDKNNKANSAKSLLKEVRDQVRKYLSQKYLKVESDNGLDDVVKLREKLLVQFRRAQELYPEHFDDLVGLTLADIEKCSDRITGDFVAVQISEAVALLNEHIEAYVLSAQLDPDAFEPTEPVEPTQAEAPEPALVAETLEAPVPLQQPTVEVLSTSPPATRTFQYVDLFSSNLGIPDVSRLLVFGQDKSTPLPPKLQPQDPNIIDTKIEALATEAEKFQLKLEVLLDEYSQNESEILESQESLNALRSTVRGLKTKRVEYISHLHTVGAINNTDDFEYIVKKLIEFDFEIDRLKTAIEDLENDISRISSINPILLEQIQLLETFQAPMQEAHKLLQRFKKVLG